MGGRGGSSGMGSRGVSGGFQYKFPGGMTRTIQRTAAGKALIDGAVSKYDYDKLKDAVKGKEGYKELSKADIAAMHEKRRYKPDYETGAGIPGGNKDNRKAARLNRLADRAARRKRRR